MKFCFIVLSVFLTLAFGGRASASSGGATNLNPALLYWQAFSILPSPEPDHLATNEWRGRVLDAEFARQIVGYDSAFKLLRQAARQQVPCDWGLDLQQGPELVLPHLPKAKRLAKTASLRVRWHLEQGRVDEARDDWLAALTLGRHVSADGILIDVLVGVAIERILTSAMAENWFRFPPGTRQQIVDGLARAPARGTMALSVRVERATFHTWLKDRIQEIQRNSGGEPEAREKVITLLSAIVTNGGETSLSTEECRAKAMGILKNGGGTTDGLLKGLAEMNPLYDEVQELMKTRYADFLPGIDRFDTKIAQHPQPLVREFFPAFKQARLREFSIETTLSMLRAAVAYQQAGETGLRTVLEPCFAEPFRLSRFEFNGVDRGIQLRSQMTANGWPETMIFVEKDGPAFHVSGNKVGQAVP